MSEFTRLDDIQCGVRPPPGESLLLCFQHRTCGNGATREEVLRRKTASAFALQLKDTKRSFAAGDDNAVTVSAGHLARAA